jgi:hypothetical protein
VGPVADKVFEPLMTLSASLGPLIGVWAGCGIGLLLTLTGILFALNALAFYLNPRARCVESELPDAVRPE